MGAYDDIAQIRASYDETLVTDCEIWREDFDDDGLSTGTFSKHHDTVCSISLYGSTQGGGSGGKSFTDTLLRTMVAQTPGARMICFTWDEDILQGDEVRLTDDTTQRFLVGLVNQDDFNRFGTQVDAMVKRPPKVRA